MLKFLIIPVLGLMLTAGTFFYEGFEANKGSVANNICEGIGSRIGVPCDKEGIYMQGYPFSYVESYGTITHEVTEAASLDFASRFVSDGDSSFNFFAWLGSFSFWSILAGAGYFIFRKIRNVVGTVVLVGLGAAAGLVYFGILVV